VRARRSGKTRNVEGQSDCVGIGWTKDEQHRLFLYVSTRVIAALIRSHAVVRAGLQAKELIISKLPASDLAGLAARLLGLLPFRGRLQAGGQPHIEDDWRDQSRGASSSDPPAEALYPLHVRREC
jgi:hypothetical protein